jgi:hypothetical protein
VAEAYARALQIERCVDQEYFEKGTQECIDERAHVSGASDVFFQINALRNDRLANLSGRDSVSKGAENWNKGTKK